MEIHVVRDLARMKKLPAQIQILGLRPRAVASIEGVRRARKFKTMGFNRPWRTGAAQNQES